MTLLCCDLVAPRLPDAILQIPLEPRHQTIQLFFVSLRQRVTRRSQHRRCNGPSPVEDFFSDSETDVRLLLVPHQRQIEVKEIFGSYEVTGKKALEHLNQHLGIG